MERQSRVGARVRSWHGEVQVFGKRPDVVMRAGIHIN
jgi:hypothetical protein